MVRPTPKVNQEDLKKAAAEEAAKRIESGQRIGLGTGSTVRYFLEALSRRLREGEISDIAGVPTSLRTAELAVSLGLPLATLEAQPILDLTVDGADEVDPQRNLIKGLGQALLREKIVAQASRRFIVIVDEAKCVARLGEGCPVPVEVLRFGYRATEERIRALGAIPTLRAANGLPVLTDQGNRIVECHFGPIDDAEALARELDLVPGILGHGLFLDLADEVLVGKVHGVVSRRHGDPGPL